MPVLLPNVVVLQHQLAFINVNTVIYHNPRPSAQKKAVCCRRVEEFPWREHVRHK